jgi:starvation-inducible DNA-binding protein
MISNLLAGHEQIIRILRKDADRCEDEYHDMGTSDFLIGLMEKHEKTAWTLRDHLDKAGLCRYFFRRFYMCDRNNLE